jgi:3'-phosphoadenosine 5'-phosphosulfate sulfotransferase (PAPS reductase)/FAD synthetase
MSIKEVMVLKKKQQLTQEEWVRSFKNAESDISREEAEQAVNEKVAEIKRYCSGMRVGYCWSGGKDSIVLGYIMEKAGFKDCMLAVCNLEYPAFIRWVQRNKPEGLEVINTGQNLEWLAKHPDLLFPKSSEGRARWFNIVQHRAQKKWFFKGGFNVITLGRRLMDGNYVGKNFVYEDKSGVVRYSPIADLSHEMIFAIIKYNKLPLPPIYKWKEGFTIGTGPWPSRPLSGSINNTWKEVYDIDPEVVRGSESYFQSARDFLISLSG